MVESARHWVLLLVLLPIVIGDPASGQTVCPYTSCYEDDRPQGRADLLVAAVNSGVGAIAVIGSRLIAGEMPSLEDVAKGLLGGAVVYAGKRIAAEPFWGSGLAGRQVASLGSSVVRNTGDDRPMLSSFDLPIGPMRIRFGDSIPVRVRFDAVTIAAAVYFSAANGGARLDFRRSLSSGALVFVGNREGLWGSSAGSSIRLPGRMDVYDEGLLLRHETIHVIQLDQVAGHFTADADEWLLNQILPVSWASHISLGLNAAMVEASGLLIHYSDRPWEIEAYRITGQWQ